MNPRWKYWVLGGLALAVIAAAIYFPALRRRVKRAAKIQQQSEEQARRELAASLVTNPGTPRVKVQMFWAANGDDPTLTPVSVELPLSNDPVLRSKQVLNTLLAGPVDSDLRTLPPDAVLLAFYLLPDGTGVADFSEALATSIPSGIESEQLAVDSIARTLEADVPQVRRLKILIHGQEVETLAGHLDLMGLFVVNTRGTQPAPPAVAAKPATPPAPVASPSAASKPTDVPKPHAPAPSRSQQDHKP
jgi:hypothetical protein